MDAYDHRISGIMNVESNPVDLFKGKPVQKSNSSEHISGRFDGNAAAWKGVRKELVHRCRSERPIARPDLRPEGAYARDSCKEHAPGCQNSINRLHSSR